MKKIMNKFKSVGIVIALLILLTPAAFSQNGIGINSTGAAADSHSMLDVVSTTKGALLPRMSQSNRTGISSPPAGLIVYQTDATAGFYYYTGSAWVLWSTGGTVTSVGLSMPSGFTVSNSPITSSGTLTVTTSLNGPLRGNGSGFTTGSTSLTSEVTGILPIANGGTNIGTIGGAGTVAYSNGSQYVFTANSGATNQVLHGSSSGTPSFGAVSLTSDVSGILPIANGGTNIGTLGSAGSVEYSTGSQIASTAVGTAGQVLTSNGSSAPTFQNLGQFSTTTSSSGIATLANASLTQIPGLGQTFTISNPMYILMNSVGQFDQSSYAGTDIVDIYFYLDGTVYFVCENWTAYSYTYSNTNWVYNASYSFNVAAGTHTVAVFAYLRTRNAAGTLTVGNVPGFVNTCYMTVTALHQ